MKVGMSRDNHAMKSTKTHLTEATENTDFTYPPSLADMMGTPCSSPSQRTRATDPSSTVRSSSMRSSISSCVNFASQAPLEGSHALARPLPDNPYCFEESDEEEVREKKAAKKSKKKKKKKRHEKDEKRRGSGSASDKQSSRRTLDISDSHHRSSSERQSSRRKMDSSARRRELRTKELEPLGETKVSPRKERHTREAAGVADVYLSPRSKEHRDHRREMEPTQYISSSPRNERRECHERNRDDSDDDVMLETSDEFLRRRRERQEQMKAEGIEVETLGRREERERREHRRNDGWDRHRHHHPSSVVSNNHHHHHSSSSAQRQHSECYIQTERTQFDLPYAGHVDLSAAAPSLPPGQKKQTPSRSSPRTRREMQIPTSIEVPTTIDAGTDHPEAHKQEKRSRRPKSDYDRLMKLLDEQSDGLDRSQKDDSVSSEEDLSAMDKLHPLIAASDDEFQEAFDKLARDSVFDDNFEKAFNEFSEHYLGLSPWGEDDSMKDKCDNTDDRQDFIRIPLTPVARKGITSYISKDSSGQNITKYNHVESSSDGMPRTPVIERGVLSVSAMDNTHEDHKKKAAQLGGEEFVKVSRTPYSRRKASSSQDSPEGDDNANEQAHQISDHSLSRARSEPSPETSDGGRRLKWGLLRGRRHASKSTV